MCARHILADKFSFKKVLACGWEANDTDTVQMLCEWADIILVVGRPSEWGLDTPPEKTVWFNIGPDVYGRYNHPELVALLLPRIEALL